MSFSCNDDKIEIIKKHDRIFTSSLDLSWKYFDSLSKVYPEIPYFIGMKSYLMAFEDKQKSYRYLQMEISNNKISKNNTFTYLAYAMMADSVSNLKLTTEEYLLKSIERDKYLLNKWAYLELSYLFEQTDTNKALVYANKALLADSLFNDAILQKAYLKDEVTDCAEIISLFKKVKPVFIDNYYLGTAYFYCKDYDNAILYFTKAAEINPNDYFSVLYLAWSNYYTHNYTQATYFFKKLPERSKIQFVYNEIVTYFLLIGENELAKHFLDESLKYNKRTFYHDGFDILILMNNNTVESFDAALKKRISFRKKYNKEQIDWLTSLFELLNEQ